MHHDKIPHSLLDKLLRAGWISGTFGAEHEGRAGSKVDFTEIGAKGLRTFPAVFGDSEIAELGLEPMTLPEIVALQELVIFYRTQIDR